MCQREGLIIIQYVGSFACCELYFNSLSLMRNAKLVNDFNDYFDTSSIKIIQEVLPHYRQYDKTFSKLFKSSYQHFSF